MYRLRNFAFLSLLLFMWPCYHALAQNGTAQSRAQWQPNVVIVQFELATNVAHGGSKTGLAAFDRRVEPFDVDRIARAFALLDHVDPTPKTARNLAALRHTYHVRYRANVEPPTVARALEGLAGVVYAEPIPMYYIDDSGMSQQPANPNDSLFSAQTHLKHMRFPEAWDVVKASDGTPPVVIAIVDGGGDWRHRDLRPTVWTNANEIAENGVDDDNNGYIDDIHGVNLANGNDNDNDPTGSPSAFSTRHGTMVAGAAGAATDNGIGLAGAAWNAKIMHINVACADREAICHGDQGLMYAAANGADIANASWSGNISGQGYEHLQQVRQTINLVTDMGTLVVAAASNSGHNNDMQLYYPARHPRVLSVGATHKDSRRIASFSNYGRTISAFAPGVDIDVPIPGNDYEIADGTSFSSPLVAGVAALVKTQFPSIGPDALREQVRMASESIEAENPTYAGNAGRGYVDAYASVQPPALPAVRLKRWSWTDSDGDGNIAAGDEVTVSATFVNHLADAQQLSIGLMGLRPYSFLDLSSAEVPVSTINGGDSVEVSLPFTVSPDSPANTPVLLITRIRHGNMVDTPDRMSFIINPSIDSLHIALSAFYNATGGDGWIHRWDISTVPTMEELLNWYGVRSTEGWFTGLNLRFNNLKGVLPPEFSSGLSHLYELMFGFNDLYGEIPKELGNFSDLRQLELWYNKFDGEIPKELGNLTQLEVLMLEWNNLTGVVPRELGNLRDLKVLTLSGNDLSGEIPVELGNLEKLERLGLSYNQLSGSIPPELGRLSLLSELQLGYNQLSGQLPDELSSMVWLERFNLRLNNISGPFPSWLKNCIYITHLDVGGNSLSGTIPKEFGKLSDLRWMELWDNNLHGEIPAELGNLDELFLLRISGNDLSGSIPKELGNLSGLILLEVTDNAISGELPKELGNLSSLEEFHFGHNRISGPIPAELGNLRHLREMYTSHNLLSGELPAELGNLGSLERLWLASNRLTGEVPSELGNLSRLEKLDLSHNQFSGQLPMSFTKLNSLQQLLFQGDDQTLCAPRDHAFQAWLATITEVKGPTCTATGTETPDELPEEDVVLHGNFPNPFRTSTAFLFDLKEPAEVELTVIDLLGRVVLNQPATQLNAGVGHKLVISGGFLSAGTYAYRLVANMSHGEVARTGIIVHMK